MPDEGGVPDDAGVPDASDDASVDASDDASGDASEDASSTSDAEMIEADASEDADIVDGSTDDAGLTDPMMQSGCGCRAEASRADSTALSIALSCVLLVILQRRRARSPRS